MEQHGGTGKSSWNALCANQSCVFDRVMLLGQHVSFPQNFAEFSNEFSWNFLRRFEENSEKIQVQHKPLQRRHGGQISEELNVNGPYAMSYAESFYNLKQYKDIKLIANV